MCFSASGHKNYKIRSLFLENLISAPHVSFFLYNLFDNLNWKKVWSLEQKFFLTNKVKEVSFKLIHRFYPVRKFIQKFRADVELSLFVWMLMKQWNTYFGHVNTLRSFRMILMLLLSWSFCQNFLYKWEILYLGILTQTPQKKIFVLL